MNYLEEKRCVERTNELPRMIAHAYETAVSRGASNIDEFARLRWQRRVKGLLYWIFRYEIGLVGWYGGLFKKIKSNPKMLYIDTFLYNNNMMCSAFLVVLRRISSVLLPWISACTRFLSTILIGPL